MFIALNGRLAVYLNGGAQSKTNNGWRRLAQNYVGKAGCLKATDLGLVQDLCNRLPNLYIMRNVQSLQTPPSENSIMSAKLKLFLSSFQ